MGGKEGKRRRNKRGYNMKREKGRRNGRKEDKKRNKRGYNIKSEKGMENYTCKKSDWHNCGYSRYCILNVLARFLKG
jgi:hypothetical protein